jgi:hypothetical protein
MRERGKEVKVQKEQKTGRKTVKDESKKKHLH